MNTVSFAQKSALTIAAALISFGANAASLTGSSSGYHYFWKQGAKMTQHDAAVVDCAVRLRAMVNGSDAMTAVAASTGGGLAGALIGGIIDSNENRQGDAANMEGCMAIAGWSVIGLGDVEGEALRGLDEPPTIHEQLRAYVEAGEPRGAILRGPYANELATGDFVVDAAKDLDKTSLSVRATKPEAEAAIAAAGKLSPPKPDLPKGVKSPKAIKGLKAEELPGADPSRAYVAFRLTGAGRVIDSLSLTLSRLAADGAEVVHDGVATTAYLGYIKGKRFQRVEDGAGKHNDHVVEIPLGRWKLATITQGAYDADLCFGAPSFEIKEGETLFLGEMALTDSGGYALDASTLETARAIFAAAPELAARVSAPEWTNGYVSDCFGSYAYAYEIPGAPFAGADEVVAEAPTDATADTISSEDRADE